jgi:hypothetical protein
LAQRRIAEDVVKIDIASFRDPAKLDAFVRRFAAIWDAQNNTASAPILALFTGTGGLDAETLQSPDRREAPHEGVELGRVAEARDVDFSGDQLGPLGQGTQAYLRQSLESEAGDADTGVRLALYFARKASTLTSAYDPTSTAVRLAESAAFRIVRVRFDPPAFTSVSAYRPVPSRPPH